MRPWWQQIWNLSLQTQALSFFPGEGAVGLQDLDSARQLH